MWYVKSDFYGRRISLRRFLEKYPDIVVESYAVRGKILRERLWQENPAEPRRDPRTRQITQWGTTSYQPWLAKKPLPEYADTNSNKLKKYDGLQVQENRRQRPLPPPPPRDTKLFNGVTLEEFERQAEEEAKTSSNFYRNNQNQWNKYPAQSANTYNFWCL